MPTPMPMNAELAQQFEDIRDVIRGNEEFIEEQQTYFANDPLGQLWHRLQNEYQLLSLADQTVIPPNTLRGFGWASTMIAGLWLDEFSTRTGLHPLKATNHSPLERSDIAQITYVFTPWKKYLPQTRRTEYSARLKRAIFIGHLMKNTSEAGEAIYFKTLKSTDPDAYRQHVAEFCLGASVVWEKWQFYMSDS